MDNRSSSSRSHPKTPTHAPSSSKGPSSASLEQAQKAWVEDNAVDLLKEMVAGKKSRGDAAATSPKYVTCYSAKEGTGEDLRYILGRVYNDFGPLALRYNGYDTLARHWISGWGTNDTLNFVQKVMICVKLNEMTPGQSPVLARLAAMIKADADEEKRRKVGSADSDEEMSEEIDLADSQEKKEKIARDRGDWVDAERGGVDEGEWIDSHGIPSMLKDAGRLLLDGFKKL